MHIVNTYNATCFQRYTVAALNRLHFIYLPTLQRVALRVPDRTIRISEQI